MPRDNGRTSGGILKYLGKGKDKGRRKGEEGERKISVGRLMKRKTRGESRVKGERERQEQEDEERGTEEERNERRVKGERGRQEDEDG